MDATSVLGPTLLIFQLLLQENCIFQQLLCEAIKVIVIRSYNKQADLDPSQMWSGALQSLNSPRGKL